MANCRRKCAAALASVVLTLTLVSVAAASGWEGEFSGVFALRGTHGYKVTGLIDAKAGDVQLFLSVSRRHEGATYVVQGTRSGEEFDFDLGALGKVEVEAQPTGHTETVRPKCGKPFALEGSTFVGTIEFRGEEGFTEARAQRTKLRYDLLADDVCGFSIQGEDFGAGIPGARLRVSRKRGPELQINQNHPGAPVRYEAQITESHPGLTIHRSTGGHLPGGAFKFDPTLTRATFGPGAPFTGSAAYRGFAPSRGTHVAQGTWRGNLTVDFPGHTAVPLTGPGFKAAIIHANRTESNS